MVPPDLSGNRARAFLLRAPIDELAPSMVAVPIVPTGFEGRGAGGIDFQPDRMYISGFD